MMRRRWAKLGILVLAWGLVEGSRASGQEAAAVPLTSIEQLVTMDPAALDQLYTQASAGTVPSGKVRGRAIVFPGTRLAGPSSKVARLCWQGKIFGPGGDTVVNRFFGLRMIRGNVYYAESWLDGRQSLIIDYSETSLVYARYRDEIREVAPGIYLGLMYARTCPQPKLKQYFALEIPQCR